MPGHSVDVVWYTSREVLKPCHDVARASGKGKRPYSTSYFTPFKSSHPGGETAAGGLLEHEVQFQRRRRHTVRGPAFPSTAGLTQFWS